MNTIILKEMESMQVPLDVYQKLADDRILFISDFIDSNIASDICATLLLKDSEDDSKITLFVNSPGGSIRDVLMICDMMRIIESPIETVCIGSAMDESALVLVSGTPGMRFATKNSIISVTQLINDSMSNADLSDAKKYLELLSEDNKRSMEIISKSTGKPLKQVMADFDRRVFMSPNQALKYGLIDKIITPNK